MQRPRPINGFRKLVKKRASTINEVVREPTAGGIVFRRNPRNQKVEFLLIQDAKERWTIPKGHVEPGEPDEVTAAREIYEETGLYADLSVLAWLGKINFRYRREQSLVLMTTQIFLMHAHGKDIDKLQSEDWIQDVQWFPATEAIDKIQYEDIAKLMLVALKKIRQKGL
jgi:8-oxo-dGTP diphosphatase